MNVIQINGLTKAYGGTRAVDGLNMRVGQGDIYGFVGKNGAGKSTTMKMIAGLVTPTSGSIKLFDEQRTDGGFSSAFSRIGTLIEQPGLLPNFSAFENLMMKALSIGVVRPREQCTELLTLVGLEDAGARKTKKFSLGMKQRLGIAQAVLNEPEVLVLDEPTAGLDPKERVRFRNLIASFAKDKIVLLSTHIVSDVEYIADRIVMMRAGQVVLTGAPDQIVGAVSGKVWEARVGAAEADRLAERLTVGNVHYLEGGEALVRIVCDERPVEGARPVEPTLEDLYLYTFAEEATQDADARRAARHARGGHHA